MVVMIMAEVVVTVTVVFFSPAATRDSNAYMQRARRTAARTARPCRALPFPTVLYRDPPSKTAGRCIIMAGCGCIIMPCCGCGWIIIPGCGCIIMPGCGCITMPACCAIRCCSCIVLPCLRIPTRFHPHPVPVASTHREFLEHGRNHRDPQDDRRLDPPRTKPSIRHARRICLRPFRDFWRSLFRSHQWRRCTRQRHAKKTALAGLNPLLCHKVPTHPEQIHPFS